MMTQFLYYRSDHAGLLMRVGRRLAAGAILVAARLVALQRLARERAQLADMDDFALKDIGLTRADMRAELRKPFWRR